jgi:hypothetical protein
MATKDEKYRKTASELAEAHRKEDPSTTEIYLFPDDQIADVRLLEVSGSAPRSGDVLPYQFDARPDLDIHFTSTVILLSPDEWKDVQDGKLKLPDDWDLTSREAV